jgi:hypothetical protein
MFTTNCFINQSILFLFFLPIMQVLIVTFIGPLCNKMMILFGTLFIAMENVSLTPEVYNIDDLLD